MKTLNEFKKVAEGFGLVDLETKRFREDCKKLGFNVVFVDGITDEMALEILSNIKAGVV